MTDVIAMYEIVADVITTEADVIAYYLWCWLMLLPIICNVVAGVIAKW